MTSFGWKSWDQVFEEMARLRRDVDRAFGGVERAYGVYPAMNVFDDGESFIARAEIPGVSPESLDVSVTGSTLTLKGERRPYEVAEGVAFHRRECDCGSFSRSLRLPEPVDSEQVKASYQNGVLEVLMPRAASAKARKVEIVTK